VVSLDKAYLIRSSVEEEITWLENVLRRPRPNRIGMELQVMLEKRQAIIKDILAEVEKIEVPLPEDAKKYLPEEEEPVKPPKDGEIKDPIGKG
jgi:hypothetical protein